MYRWIRSPVPPGNPPLASDLAMLASQLRGALSGWWWPAEEVCVVLERPAALRTEPVPGAWHGEVRLLPHGVRYRDGWQPDLTVLGYRPASVGRYPTGHPEMSVGRITVTETAPDGEGTMTTLEDRPNTALVVIDVQNGVVARAHERDTVVATIAGLVRRARAEGVPVVWVQHSDDGLKRDSDDWPIVPELDPDPAEPLVEKHYGDAFEATTLESVLTGLGVGRLVVTGAQTDACVRCTLHGAFTRGYDATLVGDAHTTEDLTAWGAPPPDQVIAHTNLYWRYQDAPGRTATVVEAKDVDFAVPVQ